MNILFGGKLGDFIHCLYIPSYIYRTTGVTSNIFLSNRGDNFEFGLEKTYQELMPILLQQEYVKSFQLWNGQNVDLDLSTFRHSNFLFKTCWTEMLSKTFIDYECKPLHGSWIKYNRSISNIKNTLLVSRKFKNPMTANILNAYEKEMSKYKNIIYLGSPEQYKQFPLNHLCQNEYPQTLSDWFSFLNSNQVFLANQSGPAAMACALNAPRIIELLPRPNHLDDIHYIGEAKYSDKISFIYPNN